jgi:hypothetical protein
VAVPASVFGNPRGARADAAPNLMRAVGARALRIVRRPGFVVGKRPSP